MASNDDSAGDGRGIHCGPGKFECFRCGRKEQFSGRPTGRKCSECGSQSWILLERTQTASILKNSRKIVAWFVVLTVLGGLTLYATHTAICALGGACP